MIQRILPKEKIPQLKGRIYDRVVFYFMSGVLVIAIIKWVISLF